jgi:hypothetical protein
VTALPPAGWYPDPEAGGSRWRWWDGAQWAPPGYGYVYTAFDPAANAHALAMRAESTRRVGRWFRWAMVAMAVGTLAIGIAFGAGLRDVVHGTYSDSANTSWGIWFDALTIPFGVVSWGYLGLFIAWLYQAGNFADQQRWPASRSRLLGAFSVLIPVVNFWWPYEAIRDNYPPGGCPRVALRWFVVQLAGSALAVWGIAGSAFAPIPVTVVVVAITAAVLAFVPILGWRLIADVEAMQRAHLPAA